ncbi:putative rhamnogalacturonate lyase C [Podospora australis]|uniref:Rhamnogalacturonate lyase C n=1 Tax=Podospora australis TaxID=1536484 RepID=A0AAN6X3V9_9PEZI|nr:putative rhamnogalacturonate lyase C [Podospora australis]
MFNLNPLHHLNNLLILLRLRRASIWEPPTILDLLLASPLQYLVTTIYHFILLLRGHPFHPPKNKPSIRMVSLALGGTDEGNGLKIPSSVATGFIPKGDLLIVLLGDSHPSRSPSPNGVISGAISGPRSKAGSSNRSADEKDDRHEEAKRLMDWLESPDLRFRHKVVVDDGRLVTRKTGQSGSSKTEIHHSNGDGNRGPDSGVQVLRDEMVTLEFRGARRLNIYVRGSDSVSSRHDKETDSWKGRIPDETDVLVTHMAPKHHQDIGLGSEGLLEEVWRVKPRLHIFGDHHQTKSGNGGRREAVYFDQLQREYEAFVAKEPKGIFRDLIMTSRWFDALRLMRYGIGCLLWKWVMAGPGSNNGGLVVGVSAYNGKEKTLKKTVVVDL